MEAAADVQAVPCDWGPHMSPPPPPGQGTTPGLWAGTVDDTP